MLSVIETLFIVRVKFAPAPFFPVTLTSAARGRGEAIGRARDVLESTVGALRDEISHLHPHQLETLGLPAALRAVAAQKARAGGFEADVHVADDAPGDHDDLVLALARELLQNAAKHADARRVRLEVTREGGAVVLLCADDGRGCDEDRAVRGRCARGTSGWRRAPSASRRSEGSWR